jgi:hypothetical protein
MTALEKPVPVIRAPKLTLSSTDLQEIAELLRAGESWPQIAKLKLKLCETARNPAQPLRRAYLAQSSQDWHGKVLELPTFELQDMTRLREVNKYTWPKIAKLKFPAWSEAWVRYRFHLRMLEEDAEPSAQDWSRSTRSQSPNSHSQTICGKDLEETRQREGKPPDSRRHGFAMSAADLQDVIRMREEGKIWREIIALKYPGWSFNTVRGWFAAKMRETEETIAEIKARKPFVMTAADRLDIARLRKEQRTWCQIVALKYPGWSIARVKNRFRSNENSVSKQRHFKMSAADIREVALLRDAGLKWHQIGEKKFPEWNHATVARHFLHLTRDRNKSQKDETDVE